MRPSKLIAIVPVLAAHTCALSFELTVLNPDFSVNVPNLPTILVIQSSSGASDGPRTMSGETGAVQVTVNVTHAEKETSTRVCAGLALRALLAKPGMPDRDNVYRAPLDESTFLVLYVLGAGAHKQFHAHLLSSANASHCIEAHFTRPLRSGEDEDNWRSSFVGAHVQDLRR